MMIVLGVFLFILGASIGSFLNVLIDRLPKEVSIMGRSHCDFCHKNIAWYDLIPVVSFFLIGRRCRYCHKKLSFFYPALEILAGLLFVGIWLGPWMGASDFYKALLLVISSTLIVIFFADVKYQIIPDSMQLLFFGCAVLLRLFTGISFLQSIEKGIVSASIVMLPILIIFLVTRGRGMGFGDVKYAFSMGYLLGIEGGFIALYVAFILGAFVGIALLVMKKKKLKSKIAFGPFLVAATGIVFIYYDSLSAWIRTVYGF